MGRKLTAKGLIAIQLIEKMINLKTKLLQAKEDDLMKVERERDEYRYNII